MDNSSLKRGVISLYHDSPTARHPGISNTTWAITEDFWWPALKKDVTKDIQGCITCQSKKNQPNKPKPPLLIIFSEAYSIPFTSIAMDFIVKLPVSDSLIPYLLSQTLSQKPPFFSHATKPLMLSTLPNYTPLMYSLTMDYPHAPFQTESLVSYPPSHENYAIP